MKKRIAALFLAILAAMSLVACGGKCKASGCDEEVYEDGYCEIHYLANQLSGLFG